MHPKRAFAPLVGDGNRPQRAESSLTLLKSCRNVTAGGECTGFSIMIARCNLGAPLSQSISDAQFAHDLWKKTRGVEHHCRRPPSGLIRLNPGSEGYGGADGS